MYASDLDVVTAILSSAFVRAGCLESRWKCFCNPECKLWEMGTAIKDKPLVGPKERTYKRCSIYIYFCLLLSIIKLVMSKSLLFRQNTFSSALVCRGLCASHLIIQLIQVASMLFSACWLRSSVQVARECSLLSHSYLELSSARCLGAPNK